MKAKASLSLTLALALAWPTLAASGTLTVSVEEAKVRKRAQTYAPAVATVHYGDTVEAGDPERGWYRVSVDGVYGWLHSSAVSRKAAAVRSGRWKGSDSASAEEVALAGKGFNDDIEGAYKKEHSELDFGAVDEMEGRALSDGELERFMKAGGTLPRGER